MSVTVHDPATLAIDATLDAIRGFNKTGVDHMKQGRMQDALSSFHAALTIISRGTGTGAQNAAAATKKQLTSARAATLNNIGCLFKRSDKPEDALRCLMEARDLEVEANGAASCSTMLNLCTVLVTVGSVDNALVVAKECVKQAEGDDYLFVVALHNLAVTQQSSSDPSEKRHATSTMLRAFGESRKRLGEDHPTTNLIREKCGLAAARPAVAAIAPRAPPKKHDAAHREFARQALRSLDFASSENTEMRGGAHAAVTLLPTITAAPEGASSSLQQVTTVDVTKGATFTTTRKTSSSDTVPPFPPIAGEPAEKEQSVPAEQTIVLADVTSPVALPPLSPAPAAAVSSAPLPIAAAPTLAHHQSEQQQPSSHPSPQITRKASVSRKPIFQQIQDERLRLKKRHLDRVAAEADDSSALPSFTRFAPPTGTTLPIPVSFADVRDELKIARLAQQNAEAAQVWIERARDQQHTNVARLNTAPVLSRAQALANKKRQIREDEELEEKRLRERKAREHELAMLEQANAERLARLRDQERHRAAVTIQRCYRHYWNTVGFKTHMARMQTVVKRSQSKVSLQATAVAKCARKWLNKTAGRRLIIRLGGARKNDFQRVVYCVEKIQRAWRYAIARLRVSRKAATRLEDRRIRVTIEKRHLAATRIQSAFRMHSAVKALEQLKGRHYWRHVCVLQKWWRRKLDQRVMSGARASRTFGRSIAATTIQRYWRGYMDRLRSAILRIQRKVTRMRETEKKCAQKIQSAGRGLIARRQLRLTESASGPRAVKNRDTSRRSDAASAISSVTSSANTRASSNRKQGGGISVINSTYHHLSILQSINEASRTREIERENHHMEIAVQAQLNRVVADHSHPSGAAVRLQRTTEDYRRSVELQRLMRLRGARLIQRTFRRWLNLRFHERERTLPLTRAIYAEKAARRKAERLYVQSEHEKLHSLFGDPARDARELKQQTQSEIDALRKEELRPEEEPFEHRDWTQRKVAVREVKQQESLLVSQMTTVRELSPGRTFITAKEQRRRLMLSQERSESAEGQEPLAIEQ